MPPHRLIVACLSFVVASGTLADAHPLGNFTINHLTRVRLAGETVRVHQVVDRAEIPAFGELRRLDARAHPSDAALKRWAADAAGGVAHDLHLIADGHELALAVDASRATTLPGAAGLRTLRLEVELHAALPYGARALAVADTGDAGRLGWRDVVFGETAEPTSDLHVYPPELVGSPRSVTATTATIAAGTLQRTDGTPAVTTGGPSLAHGDAFAALLDRDVSSPLAFIGVLLIAVALGALHALEPGHGKTLLAVSLVGARATMRQAAILAAALTAAHTTGVLALGVVVLVAARWIVPETVYPWITLFSGVVVAIVAARALAVAVRRARGGEHEHTHAHPGAHPHVHVHRHTGDDDHHLAARAAFEEHRRAHERGLAHDHGAAHEHGDLDDLEHARLHAIPGTAPLTFRGALLAAVSGNIAPCPAALVVLLAAIATHRVALGLLLIVAFSVGLAGVLTAAGIAVVRGAGWLTRNPRFDALARRAPLVTALVIAAIGSTMIAQGLGAQGIAWPVPLVAVLVFAAIGGYALTAHHTHARTVTA